MTSLESLDSRTLAKQIRSKLALAFIVKNEGRYALQMLKSVLPIVGFVSCIDTESTDDTAEMISAYLDMFKVDHIVSSQKFTRFDEMRNAAIQNVPENFEWIIMLDADEILLEKDFRNILLMMDQNTHDAWAIPRFNWIDKIWGIFTADYPDHQARLFKKMSIEPIKYAGQVHETLSNYQKLGIINPDIVDGHEFSDAIHIHHIKLFTKTWEEIQSREPLYQSLIDQSKLQGNFSLPSPVHYDPSLGTEQILEPKKIKKIHVIDIEKFGFTNQKAFWCEWDHPGEMSRSFDSIINGLISSRWGNYIRPGATCIDIGAHSGDTSIPMGLFSSDYKKNIRGKVFAIEPNPDVYGVLEINIALNSHFCDIIPFCIAITENDGEIEIFDHGNSNCNGGVIAENYSTDLKEKLKSVAKCSFKAQGYRLDNFIEKHFSDNDLRAFSFVKIDCEGYDKEILRSAKDLIMAKQPIIQVEWFDWFSAEESADLFKAISEIHYVACNPGSGTLVTESEKLPDLMLVPQGQF